MNEVLRPEPDAVPVTAPGNAPQIQPLPTASRRGLSPLNRRRLANFRANRRGFWSALLFALLFVVSLFAEFIANDRPLVVQYKGEWLFPVLVDYPDEKFGGFLAQTDYRAPETRKEIESNGWVLWPPIPYSYNTFMSDLPTPSPSRRPGC